MDAAFYVGLRAQAVESGEDEEVGRLAQHVVHQVRGLQRARAEKPRPHSGSQGTEQVNVQTFIDSAQASAAAVPMLWDELWLSTNEESYMDFRLQGAGGEPGCSNETVATWTLGFPNSHLIYSRSKEVGRE